MINIETNLICTNLEERKRVNPIEYIIIHNVQSTIKYVQYICSNILKFETIFDYLLDENRCLKINNSDNYIPWSTGISKDSEFPVNNSNVISIMVCGDINNLKLMDRLNELIQYIESLYNIRSTYSYKELKKMYIDSPNYMV